jgi:hypothetical protein
LSVKHGGISGDFITSQNYTFNGLDLPSCSVDEDENLTLKEIDYSKAKLFSLMLKPEANPSRTLESPESEVSSSVMLLLNKDATNISTLIDQT